MVAEAQRSGPQVITVRGKEAAVVLSADAYRKLQGRRRHGTLAFFLRRSPLHGVDLDLSRPRDAGRPIDL